MGSALSLAAVVSTSALRSVCRSRELSCSTFVCESGIVWMLVADGFLLLCQRAIEQVGGGSGGRAGGSGG